MFDEEEKRWMSHVSEVLLLYYAGQGVQGLPRKLARKRRLGIFVDRVGISHDLALVSV